MERSRLQQQMQFLTEIDKLKSVSRQNVLSDGSRRENDSEHSWHLAMMVIVLSEHFEGMGILKTLKMVLIHHVAFKIQDEEFDYYLRKVRALGLDLKEPRPRVEGEGRSLYFYDFDNHLFELHTGTLSERLTRYGQERD